MKTGSRPASLLVSVATALVGGLLALSVVRGGVVAVSRFGDGVRILAGGWGLSFLPLERRIPLAEEGGAATLAAELGLQLPGGSTLPAKLIVLVEGDAALPVSGFAVREFGLEESLGKVLTPHLRLDGADLDAVLHSSQLWREVFPLPGAAAIPDLADRLRPALAPLRVIGASLEVIPDEGLVRAAVRSDLRRLAPPRGRLIVIGLDALDWALVDESTRRGTMPNLARLLDRGLQVTVRMRPPLLSPLIWTTIATGQPPDVHGVLDFVEQDPETGQPKPVTSLSRKATALWEMAAACGRTSAVIGWWATYPASAPHGGAVYSDRLTEQLMGIEENRPGLADPMDAALRARDLAVRGSRVTPAMLAPILEVTQAELDAVPTGPAAWDSPVGGAARLMAATITVERLTDAELERGTEVVLSYLEGTDTVGHLFGMYRPPAMPGTDPALARRFGPVPDRYHAYVDAWLGRVVARMTPVDTLVILSDHGFAWGDDRPTVASGAHTPTAVFWHRPDASFLAVGPRVAPDASRRRMEPLDILPAFLALAGLPIGEDLPGRPPVWLLEGERPDRPAVRYAALSPVVRPAAAALPDEAREEELAKLRALGYLAGEDAQPSGAAPTPAATAPPAEPTADVRRLEARRQHNLGLTRADAGDLGAAEQAFRAAIASAPDYPPPHYALARVLRITSRHDEADRELWRSVDLGIGDAPGALARAAGEYRKLKLPERAGGVLARAVERFPDGGPLWLDLGTLAGEQGDFALAARCLERAVALMPGEVVAHRNLGAARLALGDVEGARRSFGEALRLDPANQGIRQQLEALSRSP
ncbi:MAG: alkaline phosphatase family protein [Acidobacteriota bacterium]